MPLLDEYAVVGAELERFGGHAVKRVSSKSGVSPLWVRLVAFVWTRRSGVLAVMARVVM